MNIISEKGDDISLEMPSVYYLIILFNSSPKKYNKTEF